MKRTSLLAAIIAGVLSIQVAGDVQAQQATGRVALLDVSYIFKNHARFKAMMSEMQADVERAEAQFKAEREAVQKMAESINDYRKGTPDYKALEEEIARRQTDLALKVQMQKKEFLSREAKVYHTVYQEVVYEVQRYCQRQGIAAVMRFNGDPVDIEQPEHVLRDINKAVVWYAKELDITPHILAALNSTQNQGVTDTRSRPGVPAPGFQR